MNSSRSLSNTERALLVAALFAPLAAIGWRALAERARDAEASDSAARALAVQERAWSGTLALENGGELRALVVALHADPQRQAFDARALGARLGVAAGEPWWCQLELGADARASLALEGLAVLDERGEALSLPNAKPSDAPDAWAALCAAPAALAPGDSVELLLWGRAPESAARLALGGVAPLALAESSRPAEERALALRDARAAPETLLPEAEIARLRTRVAELTVELATQREARLARENAWLAYTRSFAHLGELGDVEAPRFETEAAPPAAGDPASDPASVAAAEPAAPPDPELALRARRSRDVHAALRSLFVLEQIGGLDLLESGELGAGCIGPVVLRLLDETGRPLGSLYAERLRLEGSRAARTLTLVLEHGAETRAGERIPFEGTQPDAEGRGGVRRIVLVHVDPAPWIDALPELFPAEQQSEAPVADPASMQVLRRELNRLLARDAAGLVHRVDALSGIEGRVLRDVRLSVLSDPRKVEKELFADRLSILRAEQGLELLLEGGSQFRAGQKLPFLSGRYRIFLPRASAADWEAAGIPIAGNAQSG